MNKWEYTTLYVPEKGSLNDELNYFGEEGWEAFHLTMLPGGAWRVAFKRSETEVNVEDNTK